MDGTRTALVLIVSMIILSFGCSENKELLSPTEVRSQINEEWRAKAEQIRQEAARNGESGDTMVEAYREIAERHMDSMATQDLDTTETLNLAAIYRDMGDYNNSLTLYDSVLQEATGDIARNTSISRIMTTLRAENADAAEKAILWHQRNVAYPENGDSHLFTYLRSYLQQLSQSGSHQRIVDIIQAELDRMPREISFVYMAPALAVEYKKSFDATGKAGYGESIARSHLEQYEALIERYENQMNSDEGMATSERVKYSEMQQQLERYKTVLNNYFLVGAQAPSIQFQHVFNEADNFSFADSKGSVVIIDFWANWCAPCKKAFPKLRELYQQYRDEGLVILGVTGFQGGFTDGDIAEQDISPERELELTEEFIERHEITWPIVFSEEGAFDSRYGVTSIPTMVFIDRAGTVRAIQSGLIAQNDTIQLIERLLEE